MSNTTAAENIADYCAALARLEQIVNHLRHGYVADGFTLDEEGAARALAYFRNLAAGGTDDKNDSAVQAEWAATLEFVYKHGQSLDWIIDGNPGAMICKLASYSERAGRAQS